MDIGQQQRVIIVEPLPVDREPEPVPQADRHRPIATTGRPRREEGPRKRTM